MKLIPRSRSGMSTSLKGLYIYTNAVISCRLQYDVGVSDGDTIYWQDLKKLNSGFC
jgi:hypothetical protein